MLHSESKIVTLPTIKDGANDHKLPVTVPVDLDFSFKTRMYKTGESDDIYQKKNMIIHNPVVVPSQLEDTVQITYELSAVRTNDFCNHVDQLYHQSSHDHFKSWHDLSAPIFDDHIVDRLLL